MFCGQKGAEVCGLQQGAPQSEKPADPKRNGSTFLFLQVFTQLRSVLADTAVSLHLVEVSPALSRIQAETLTRTCSHEMDDGDGPVYLGGETATGLPVSWYRCLEDVPAGTRGEVLRAGFCGCLTPSVCRVQHLRGSRVLRRSSRPQVPGNFTHF